jgi:predicted SprT family Zn-dependent metalloprotease
MSWSKVELGALKRAVALHGRDWAAVSSSVGSKTRKQCLDKVKEEVRAGRMQEPGGKLVRDSWSKVELGALKRAVALHGRDWAAVASSVGGKTQKQCINKVATEIAAGRMQEPGGQVKDSWSQVELGALKRVVALHGRDWAAVASSVGSKTSEQCKHKVFNEAAAGRMQEPGGKQVHDSWSEVEKSALERAVQEHGRDWAAVASSVGSKSRKQCSNRFQHEVASGRWRP